MSDLFERVRFQTKDKSVMLNQVDDFKIPIQQKRKKWSQSPFRTIQQIKRTDNVSSIAVYIFS